MTHPSLNDLSAFSAVAQHRSFRKAADGLGVSRSALSHAITGLEDKLNLRLLNRTTRSVSLTQAGAALLERLDPVLRDLDAALDTLTEVRGRPSGTLRINANKSGARVLLRDVVPRFIAACPEVELDLVSKGKLVDIVVEGFDAGVRLLEAVPQDMVAVRIGGDARFVTVAAPSYLRAKGMPRTPNDLLGHVCIRQRLPSGKRYRWEFSRRGDELALDVPGTLTLDDSDLLAETAAGGHGIAYLPEHFARPFLENGQLCLILEDWCPPIDGLALYYPRNRHMPSTLRAFIDILKAGNVRD